LNVDINHIGVREMTKFTTNSLAGFAAALLTVVMFAQTYAVPAMAQPVGAGTVVMAELA